MSRKKPGRRKPNGAVEKRGARRADPVSASAPEPRAGWWPEDFASPRLAALIGVALALVSVALFYAVLTNQLLWVKRLTLWVLGAFDPMTLPHGATSLDIGVVLWGVCVVVGLAVIHPVLALAPLLLARPWLDGYTYPTDNFYFVWGVLFLFTLWALRLFMRGGEIRGGWPAVLLGGFLAVAAVGAFGAAHPDKAYRLVLIWCGHAALFVLIVNIARTRGMFALLLGAIVLTCAAQALFSLFHFQYLLPYLREQLERDPRMLMQYFGTDTFTPELARRFNINRAFGTMLFPNALAGFLILLLPIAALGSMAGFRRWRAAMEFASAHDEDAIRYRVMALAGVIWALGAAAVFFMLQFPPVFDLGANAWYHNTAVAFGLAVVVGGVPAGVFFRYAQQNGLWRAGFAVWALGLAAMTPLLIYVLWITYSRGAMMALFFAAIAGFIVLRGMPRRWALQPRRAAAALLCVVGAVAFAEAVTAPAGWAQAPAAEPPRPGVTREGLDIGIEELADPASFRIRLTYWRVGTSMLREFWLTGAGFGGFEAAYPNHQYLGAGDVREAHNGFLQAFIETGVLGGALFSGFWAYFAIWGGRRLRALEGPPRLLMAGLYIGVLAFLAHAFIDIHFSHAGLTFLALSVTALFYAWMRMDDPPGAPRSAHQLMALILLVTTALTVGLGVRIFMQDLALSRASFINVANTADLDYRKRLGQFFVQEVVRYALDRELPPPRIAMRDAMVFVPDKTKLFAVGDVVAPDPANPRRGVQIRPEDPIPPNAVYQIRRPFDANGVGKRAAMRWLESLERIDARFPRSARLALYLADWYEMWIEYSSPDGPWGDVRASNIERQEHWAREAMRRSPLQADLHFHLAEHLFLVGYRHEDETRRWALWEESLESARRAIELNPVQHIYLLGLSNLSGRYAEELEKAGRGEEAARYREEAAALEREAGELHQQRIAAGMY